MQAKIGSKPIEDSRFARHAAWCGKCREYSVNGCGYRIERRRLLGQLCGP